MPPSLGVCSTNLSPRYRVGQRMFVQSRHSTKRTRRPYSRPWEAVRKGNTVLTDDGVMVCIGGSNLYYSLRGAVSGVLFRSRRTGRMTSDNRKALIAESRTSSQPP